MNIKTISIIISIFIIGLWFLFTSLYSKVIIVNKKNEVLNIKLSLNNIILFDKQIKSLSKDSFYFNANRDGSFNFSFKNDKFEKTKNNIGYISPNIGIVYKITIENNNTIKYEEKY